MKNLILVTIGSTVLAGCCASWTDRATFEHPKTGQIKECGECMSGRAAMLGVIGEQMANSEARQCFRETLEQGYEAVSYTQSHGAMQTSTTLTGDTARQSVRGAINMQSKR